MCTNRTFEVTMRGIGLATPMSQIGRNSMDNLENSDAANEALKNKIKNLTEEEFFKNIYVLPFNTDTTSAIEEDDIESLPTENISYDAEDRKRREFEDDLKILSKSTFTIKGASGTGKTTYVRSLKYKDEFQNNYKWYICDLEACKSLVKIFGIQYNFRNLSQPILWMFASKLLEQINDIIKSKYVNESEKEDIEIYNSRIKNIVDKYNAIFTDEQEVPISDDRQVSKFFKMLSLYSINDKQKFSLYKYYKEYIDPYKNKPEDAIRLIVDILIRLFLCLFQIDGTKQICVIDNIEYFVDLYEEDNRKKIIDDADIQINDIQKIYNIIIESCSAMDNQLDGHPIYNNKYYGFVLVRRNATKIKLPLNAHLDDAKKFPEVDTTSWFDFKQILDKKTTYFEPCLTDIMKKIEDYKKFYENIMSDSSSKGVRNYINRMYNYSYRRIIENVTSAIALNMQDYECRHFNEVWNKLKNPGQDDIHQKVKGLCRNFVIRQLLNYIQDTCFFTNIINPSGSNPPPEIDSYARRITTMLHCANLNNIDFISFQQLIDTVLKKPYNKNIAVLDNEVEYLVKVLDLMNEPRNEKTHFNALIEIKYGEGSFKNGHVKLDEIKNSNIKITESGSFYAHIVAHFEYFACRVTPDLSALRTTSDSATEKDIDGRLALETKLSLFALSHLRRCGDSYICIKIIEAVRNKAFSCIKNVMDRDKSFCTGSSNGNIGYDILYNDRTMYSWLVYKVKLKGKPFIHPLRILDHHIRYLNSYRDYVRSFLDEECFKDSDRGEIVQKVEAIIREYETRRYDLTSNPEYATYFNNVRY